MKRGYIRLWRKIENCEVLRERGKRYSRLEAWIDLVMNKAAGIATADLQRGEFAASYRALAKRWNWSKSATERYMNDLQAGPNPMIRRLGQFVGQFVGHFIICKYDTYNPTRDTKWDSLWDTYKININEIENKESCPPKADLRLFEIYESENKKLPQVKARTQDRLGKCRSRINQARRNGCLEQYLSDFRAAVQKAQLIPFLCGCKGWRANFDWFIANQTNVYAVLEGKYDSAVPAKTADLYIGGDSGLTPEQAASRKRALEEEFGVIQAEETA